MSGHDEDRAMDDYMRHHFGTARASTADRRDVPTMAHEPMPDEHAQAGDVWVRRFFGAGVPS